jgi:chromosome segregation ATPase
MGLELLLPVILFLITLVIIYLLRAEDKRDRRLELMKQRVGQFSREIDFARSEFKDTAQQVEEKINHKIEASNQMLNRIDEQLSDLQMRSDDLYQLQEVLNRYRDSLNRLGSSTAQVEERIAIVQQDARRVEAVKAVIDDFDARIEAFHDALNAIIEQGTDALQSQQLRIKELLDASYAKIQEYEADVQEVERANLSRVASHAQQLKTQETESLAMLAIQLGKIRQLQDDVQQVVSENRKAFEDLREQSLQDVEQQEKLFHNLAGENKALFEQQQKDQLALVDQAQDQISKALCAFSKQCNSEMEDLFHTSLVRIDDVFQTMITTVVRFMQDVQNLKDEQAQALVQLEAGRSQKEELELAISRLKEESAAMHQELASLAKQKQESEKNTWVEYVLEGDEEEISLDEEEEKTT